MVPSIRQNKFLELRESYPWFAFEDYVYDLSPEGLTARFHFSLAGKVHFRPRLHVPRKPWFLPDNDIRAALPVLLFQIGLVEMISYWKAACPPRLIIRPHGLTLQQADWWRNLYFHGLGEFFYRNGLSVSEAELFTLETGPAPMLSPCSWPGEGGLIPVGGGKDSAVTLELLRNNAENQPFILNPRGATLNTVSAAGIPRGQVVEVTRTLDPELLALNAKGFLNGHTPFSAMLGFYAALAALLSGKRFAALSNESSANESTVSGSTVNHQYSKSYAFESTLRDYLRQFVAPDFSYFSLLRPLSELQIASLFARMPQYHAVFRSCNAGSKTDTWCGACAKCLFTRIILAPFLSDEAVVAIFGREIFDDDGLAGVLSELTGETAEKPFDCVGTTDEVNLALQETLRRRGGEPLPALLARYAAKHPPVAGHAARFRQALLHFDTAHHLTPDFETLLKSKLHG